MTQLISSYHYLALVFFLMCPLNHLRCVFDQCSYKHLSLRCSVLKEVRQYVEQGRKYKHIQKPIWWIERLLNRLWNQKKIHLCDLLLLSDMINNLFTSQKQSACIHIRIMNESLLRWLNELCSIIHQEH